MSPSWMTMVLLLLLLVLPASCVGAFPTYDELGLGPCKRMSVMTEKVILGNQNLTIVGSYPTIAYLGSTSSGGSLLPSTTVNLPESDRQLCTSAVQTVITNVDTLLPCTTTDKLDGPLDVILTPGVHCFTTAATGLVDKTQNITFDGLGDSNSRFYLRYRSDAASGTLRLSHPLVFVNGATESNVIWIVEKFPVVGFIALRATLQRGIFLVKTVVGNINIAVPVSGQLLHIPPAGYGLSVSVLATTAPTITPFTGGMLGSPPYSYPVVSSSSSTGSSPVSSSTGFSSSTASSSSTGYSSSSTGVAPSSSTGVSSSSSSSTGFSSSTASSSSTGYSSSSTGVAPSSSTGVSSSSSSSTGSIPNSSSTAAMGSSSSTGSAPPPVYYTDLGLGPCRELSFSTGLLIGPSYSPFLILTMSGSNEPMMHSETVYDTTFVPSNTVNADSAYAAVCHDAVQTLTSNANQFMPCDAQLADLTVAGTQTMTPGVSCWNAEGAGYIYTSSFIWDANGDETAHFIVRLTGMLSATDKYLIYGQHSFVNGAKARNILWFLDGKRVQIETAIPGSIYMSHDTPELTIATQYEITGQYIIGPGTETRLTFGFHTATIVWNGLASSEADTDIISSSSSTGSIPDSLSTATDPSSSSSTGQVESSSTGSTEAASSSTASPVVSSSSSSSGLVESSSSTAPGSSSTGDESSSGADPASSSSSSSTGSFDSASSSSTGISDSSTGGSTSDLSSSTGDESSSTGISQYSSSSTGQSETSTSAIQPTDSSSTGSDHASSTGSQSDESSSTGLADEQVSSSSTGFDMLSSTGTSGDSSSGGDMTESSSSTGDDQLSSSARDESSSGADPAASSSSSTGVDQSSSSTGDESSSSGDGQDSSSTGDDQSPSSSTGDESSSTGAESSSTGDGSSSTGPDSSSSTGADEPIDTTPSDMWVAPVREANASVSAPSAADPTATVLIECFQTFQVYDPQAFADAAALEIAQILGYDAVGELIITQVTLYDPNSNETATASYTRKLLQVADEEGAPRATVVIEVIMPLTAAQIMQQWMDVGGGVTLDPSTFPIFSSTRQLVINLDPVMPMADQLGEFDVTCNNGTNCRANDTCTMGLCGCPRDAEGFCPPDYFDGLTDMTCASGSFSLYADACVSANTTADHMSYNSNESCEDRKPLFYNAFPTRRYCQNIDLSLNVERTMLVGLMGDPANLKAPLHIFTINSPYTLAELALPPHRNIRTGVVSFRGYVSNLYDGKQPVNNKAWALIEFKQAYTDRTVQLTRLAFLDGIEGSRECYFQDNKWHCLTGVEPGMYIDKAMDQEVASTCQAYYVWNERTRRCEQGCTNGMTGARCDKALDSFCATQEWNATSMFYISHDCLRLECGRGYMDVFGVCETDPFAFESVPYVDYVPPKSSSFMDDDVGALSMPVFIAVLVGSVGVTILTMVGSKMAYAKWKGRRPKGYAKQPIRDSRRVADSSPPDSVLVQEISTPSSSHKKKPRTRGVELSPLKKQPPRSGGRIKRG